MVYQMIFSDILRFASIYVLLLLAFAPAFFLVFMNAGEDNSYQSLSHSFAALFLTSFGYFDFTQVQNLYATNEARGFFAHLLFFVFVVLVLVLMINLLIAMMGNTFNSVYTNSEVEWRWQWCTIVFQIEQSMTKRTKDYFKPKNRLLQNGEWYMLIEEENAAWKADDKNRPETAESLVPTPLPDKFRSDTISRMERAPKEDYVSNADFALKSEDDNL